MWQSSGVPWLCLPWFFRAESVANHVGDILEVGPDFWVFSPDDQILIECLQDGRVTLALIPKE